MKKIVVLFPLLMCVVISIAQDKIPAFGKIDKADLEMKDCDFDPGAEAVVLIDLGEITFRAMHDTWEYEAEYRVRTKILKASALDRAQIKMGYYSKNQTQYISGISGVSYNLDAGGNVVETKMEKAAVFNKSIDKDNSEISFALPDVKAGTVFEYKYRIVTKSFGYIPAWRFQKRVPVKYSAYNITIPEYFHFTVQMVARQKLDKFEKDKSTWYIMHNVPGLKDEPYSSGREGYLQRIEFQLSKIVTPSFYQEYNTTWPKLIDKLLEDEDFGVALKKNIKNTDELDEKLKTITSAKEKIRAVYNYVQSNMQWNEEYDIYSGGIKDAWDKKNGTIADINFILISLLRDAGIEARPLLASTKDNGMVNTVFPFLRQFNCVLAYVQEADEIFIMNAADKFNPYNLIPYDVLYTTGLVVNKKEGGLVSMNSDKKYTNNIFFTATIDEGGKLSGTGNVSCLGYARNIRSATYRKNQLKAMLEDNEGITIKVDSLQLKNEKDELLPLDQKVQFSGNIQSSGDYYFLPYSLFTGIGKNPFIEEERVMDIDFDYPKSYVITGAYVLPDNYVVNELPKNTKMILPDTSVTLTRMTQQDGNIINFRVTLIFNTPGYTAESYPYIKEFFKQLYNILDERIVLKKK